MDNFNFADGDSENEQEQENRRDEDLNLSGEGDREEVLSRIRNRQGNADKIEQRGKRRSGDHKVIKRIRTDSVR